jgi:macrophage erythroblast attacher
VLAAGLPFAHFNNSYLTCALTGQRMDHANPPVALPNGRVYSQKAVHELLTVQGGEQREEGQQPCVRCPRTGEIFPLSQVRSIFII